MIPELERAISILKDSPDFAAVLAGKTLREEVERLQEELAARLDTTEQKKELEQAKEREKQLQSRLMEVLLAQAINATKEERKRLLESEQIPREIWEIRFS